MAHPLVAADVYNRMGGQQALTQLMNPSGTITWNVAMLDTAMGDAWNFVVAAVGVQAELAGYTDSQIREQYPQLITIAAQKSLRFGWLGGSGGQALPQGIKDIDELADAQLQLLAERRRKHGAVGVSPAPAQQISQVRIDQDNSRMTLGGFRSAGGLI